MTQLTTAAQVLDLKAQMRSEHKRIAELHTITYREQDLSSLANIIAPDYRKAFIPLRDPSVLREKYRKTNVLSSNQFELSCQALTTDASEQNAVQKLEHGLVALAQQLFPHAVRERMYRILDEPYCIASLDISAKREALAQYADRDALRKYAEEDGEEDDDDYSPQAKYRRAYRATSETDERDYRHEQAYSKVTKDASIADGIPYSIRVLDPFTFDAPPPGPDNPNRLMLAIEYGRKQLNPLLEVLKDTGVRLDKKSGRLYIEDKGDKRKRGKTTEATVGVLVPDDGSEAPGQEYVEFTQFRDQHCTYTVIEHPKPQPGDKGVLIKTPNMYAGQSTGYYLIEGNVRGKPAAVLEECYDPILYPLQVYVQQKNIYRSAEGAMALDDATRSPYRKTDDPNAKMAEGMDPTEETKAALPQDGQPAPIVQGELRKEEARGANLREFSDKIDNDTQASAPTPFPEGSGGSSESFAHLAAVQSIVFMEDTPIQIKIAECVRNIIEDICRCIAESGEELIIPYVAEGQKKPEMRTITPQMARLPVKIEVSLAASSPQADAANEVMSERRWKNGLIGRTEHAENIKIVDPEHTYARMLADMIDDGVAPRIAEIVVGIVGEVGEQSLREHWGIPKPPQIVGPDGQPISSQPTPGASPAPTQRPVPPIQEGGSPTMGAQGMPVVT